MIGDTSILSWLSKHLTKKYEKYSMKKDVSI